MARAEIAIVVPSYTRRFRRAAQALGGIVRRDFETRLGPEAVRITRAVAPRGKGALGRGLRQQTLGGATGPLLEVVSTVRSREGYPYTGVTRFGHRKAKIYPKTKRALKTPWGPRRWVRGYRPARDWADTAHRRIQPAARRSADRIGREFARAAG